MTTINDLAATALAAVTARGYRANCDDVQFVARNLCKAAEELAEASGAVFTHRDMADPMAPFPRMKAVDGWLCAIAEAGNLSRAAFDAWGDGIHGIDADIIRAELPDAIIPLLCAAVVLGVDLDAAIRAKLAADVGRGVR